MNVDKRLSRGKEALRIGLKRSKNGDFEGAAQAYRFGLWQLNFENKQDVVWYTGEMEKARKARTTAISGKVDATVGALHFGLASELLRMCASGSQPFETVLTLATESAAQASACITLDGENVEAIHVRGRGRTACEDFEGARLDFLECERRTRGDTGQQQRFKRALEDLKVAKAKAIKREKKLWGRKGFLLEQEGYSFMGREEGGLKATATWFVKSNPGLLVLLFVFACFAVVHCTGWDVAYYARQKERLEVYEREVMKMARGEEHDKQCVSEGVCSNSV